VDFGPILAEAARRRLVFSAQTCAVAEGADGKATALGTDVDGSPRRAAEEALNEFRFAFACCAPRPDLAGQSPAVPNGRCRMHGGTNPGAPKGNRNAFKQAVTPPRRLPAGRGRSARSCHARPGLHYRGSELRSRVIHY
jgi:hypothetical protein